MPPSIEEPAAGFVMKILNHLYGDFLREAVIAEVSRDFVGIKASNHGKGVVVEQSGNVTVLRGRIRVGDHVLESLLGGPSVREQPIERAQCKMLRVGQFKHLCRLEVGGDTESVPADVDRLIHIRS